MRKIEAQFQARFSKWVQNRWVGVSTVFELKRTLSQSLPIATIKEHQVIALTQATASGSFFKIPDGGFSQAPYDCYILKGEAYVGIAYGRRLVGFYLVPIASIQKLKDDKVVSITETMSKELGTHYLFPTNSLR